MFWGKKSKNGSDMFLKDIHCIISQGSSERQNQWDGAWHGIEQEKGSGSETDLF